MKVARAAAFLLGLGWEIDRARLLRATVLLSAGCVAGPLAAAALGRFSDAVLAGHAPDTLLYALLAPCLLVAEAMLGYFAHLDYYELGELQESQLRRRLMRVVNGAPGIEHLDEPAFADGVALVREALFGNRRALEGVLQLLGLLVQALLTALLLIQLSPWLGVLPLFALPPVWLSRRAQTLVERAREASIEDVRRADHWLELATLPASLKELRLFGVEAEAARRHAAAWQTTTRILERGHVAGATLRGLGQLCFAAGYGGAALLMMRQAMRGEASVGDLVLVLTLSVQVSLQISTALQLLALLQSTCQTIDRMALLGHLAARRRSSPLEPPGPSPAASGIVLQNVSFGYRQHGPLALDDVTLSIPAGATVAIVGENGAGKSTLVKLLCGLYQPSSGRIWVDGNDVSSVASSDRGSAVLFQDFARIELSLRESIGLGDVQALDDDARLRTAIHAARGERLLELVAGGLGGVVGRAYAAGTELSGGQWQTVGLARCSMRPDANLLVLDEPAAALDAAAEHDLFERYAQSADSKRQARRGVTLLITHRFSTVLMADSIIVLQKGRVVERGSHRELMAQGGLYAELFALQARAYRASPQRPELASLAEPRAAATRPQTPRSGASSGNTSKNFSERSSSS